MNKGMLPLALAFDIERDIYDFLNVAFEIKGNKSGKELESIIERLILLLKGHL